ncbi:hypothetical protein Leryth_017978 [Lithospermum erythrorhizon]|nr:hypothetical protein Leryth_017978 [Lithospermum erythrorhizon]
MLFSSEKDPIFANNTDNIDVCGLLCDENDIGFGFDDVEIKNGVKKCVTLLEYDVFWENEEVLRLLCKEKETLFGFGCNNVDECGLGSNGSFRQEAVEWIMKVVEHYGFSCLSGVLAVGYYDRFVCSVYFQKDKPWMSQLVAVACLSIAAKMEEIQVPLLLDLQVEKSKYVFEAKTIMRMELLVLSTLKWRTSIVTPISFFDHFVRRFGLWTNHHKEFSKRCEQILLSVIPDSRILGYVSSVIATAIMLFVLNEIDPEEVMDYRNQLLDILGTDKEKVKEFYQLIMEVMGSHSVAEYGSRKRKQMSVPSSPSGVIDAYISYCDSSNDSWSVASSVSSSPEPFFKRSKAQDQPMRLVPLRSISMGTGGRFC